MPKRNPTHPLRMLKKDGKWIPNPEYKRWYYRNHREESLRYGQEWHLKNKERLNEIHRIRREDMRKEILKLLGNKCVICGYSGIALEIDHVKGGGCLERRHFHHDSYYKHILEAIKIGSQEYQLLCANCNQIKKHLTPQENGGTHPSIVLDE